MNVYDEIEKFYLEKNSKIKFLKNIDFVFGVGFIIIFISMIISFLFLPSEISDIILSIISIIITICFLLVTLFKEKMVKFSLDSFDPCSDMKGIVKILKANNVCSKKALEIIILYFKDRKSLNTKSDNFYNILSMIIAIAAYSISIYNNVEITDALSMIIFAALIVLLSYLLRWTFSLFSNFNDELYSKIEGDLTYIYLNYDLYFYTEQVKKRKMLKSFTTYMKRILSLTKKRNTK